MRLSAGIAATLIALAVLGTAFLSACRNPDLPVQGMLPDFQLVDQAGQLFSLAQARGKVVVLGLIYTHCPDICPLITYRMQSIKDQLVRRGIDSEVLFLTVTFDPERDTPRYFAPTLRPTTWTLETGGSSPVILRPSRV